MRASLTMKMKASGEIADAMHGMKWYLSLLLELHAFLP